MQDYIIATTEHWFQNTLEPRIVTVYIEFDLDLPVRGRARSRIKGAGLGRPEMFTQKAKNGGKQPRP